MVTPRGHVAQLEEPLLKKQTVNGEEQFFLLF